LALAYVPRAARALESYSGVGLEIFVGPDGAVKVVEAFGAGYAKKAGPAYEAGVRVNDAIVSVDGKTTGRLDGLEGIAKALRGPTGSAVTVEVERKVKGGKRVAETLELVRSEVDPSARSCFVSTCRRA
jgi:C-terminal processing protease CtpA/Prc